MFWRKTKTSTILYRRGQEHKIAEKDRQAPENLSPDTALSEIKTYVPAPKGAPYWKTGQSFGLTKKQRTKLEALEITTLGQLIAGIRKKLPGLTDALTTARQDIKDVTVWQTLAKEIYDEHPDFLDPNFCPAIVVTFNPISSIKVTSRNVREELITDEVKEEIRQQIASFINEEDGGEIVVEAIKTVAARKVSQAKKELKAARSKLAALESK